MVRAMVHSTKHISQMTLTSATTGATAIFTPIRAVERTLANTGNEVQEGCTIKAVWVEMWQQGGTGDQFFTAIIAKLPGGVGNIIQADLVDLFSYDNKKNIFYTTQGLASNDGLGPPGMVFKGWIKIPKSKQRFGLGDALQFAFSSRGDGQVDMCGLFLYKEYT